MSRRSMYVALWATSAATVGRDRANSSRSLTTARRLRPIPATNRYRAAPLTRRIDVPWMVGNHGRAVPREACVAPRDPGHVPRRPRHTVRANDSQPRYPQRVAAGQDLRRELLSRRRDLPTALLTGGEAHRHGQVHWAHHT